MRDQFVVASAVVFMLLVSSQAPAQTPPPAYFEATGTYETYFQGGNSSIGIWDCAGVPGCNDVNGPIPPWTSASGKAATIGLAGLSISTSFGDVSGAAVFQGLYGAANDSIRDPYNVSNYSRLQNGTVSVYVLGPPGTSFHLRYSYAEMVNASKTLDETCQSFAGATFSGAFAGITNQSVSASAVGDSQQLNASDYQSVDGATTSETRLFQGATYSLHSTYCSGATSLRTGIRGQSRQESKSNSGPLRRERSARGDIAISRQTGAANHHE
jgi:hypothetical protein